ncbi:TIGR02217 family protein [Devosia sp. XGJD_8]|uniref:phage distal tail protein, Rcc01695 family n=1 Tax=Devosia sp. XGJD_8 TaxID=3391187 RepID=UPI003984E828
MTFHPIRFPLDVALGARGGPERRTDVVTLASGREQRNGRWQHSRRRYNAGYGVKSRADMAAVLAFFEERRGRLHGFLWRDGLDFSSGGAVPTPLDQPIGMGDGSRTGYQLTKRYGGSFDPYFRPITRPVAGSVRVAVAGVEVLTGWSVDGATGLVGFTTPPANGAAVTAGFLFDVPVRFDTDRLDVELSSFDGAEAPSIPLVEILP